MIDTNLLQNTQEKYICGQYDNKLACIVIGLRLMYTQFDQFMKKKRVSIIYNVLSRYIDYCNSLVATVVTVTRPQS